MGGITPTPKMAIFAPRTVPYTAPEMAIFAPRTVPYTAPEMAAFAPNMALIIHRNAPKMAPYTAGNGAPNMALTQPVLIAIHRRLLSFFGTAPND